MIETSADVILALVGITGAFGIGAWLGQRRVWAILDVIDAFRDQSRTYYEAAGDGEISDEDAHAIAKVTQKFFCRLDAAVALFAAA